MPDQVIKKDIDIRPATNLQHSSIPLILRLGAFALGARTLLRTVTVQEPGFTRLAFFHDLGLVQVAEGILGLLFLLAAILYPQPAGRVILLAASVLFCCEELYPIAEPFSRAPSIDTLLMPDLMRHGLLLCWALAFPLMSILSAMRGSGQKLAPSVAQIADGDALAITYASGYHLRTRFSWRPLQIAVGIISCAASTCGLLALVGRIRSANAWSPALASPSSANLENFIVVGVALIQLLGGILVFRRTMLGGILVLVGFGIVAAFFSYRFRTDEAAAIEIADAFGTFAICAPLVLFRRDS